MKALTDAVKKQDEKGVLFDKYYVAGYDPPFKLLGRRNEIWFVKSVTEGQEEQHKLSNGMAQAFDGVQIESLECALGVEDQLKMNQEDTGAKGSTEDGQEGA